MNLIIGNSLQKQSYAYSKKQSVTSQTLQINLILGNIEVIYKKQTILLHSKNCLG
jgi:hypothetical protein